MPLTFTTARKLDDGSYLFTIEDADLDYVRDFDWSPRDTDLYPTAAAYESMMINQASALAVDDITKLTATQSAGRKLSVEGDAVVTQ